MSQYNLLILISLWGSIIGQPYIITLDGYFYKINITGDYNLTYDTVFNTQVRYIGTYEGSICTGLLIKYDNFKIMVDISTDTALLYINKPFPIEFASGDRLGLFDNKQIGYLFINKIDSILIIHIVFTISGHGVDIVIRRTKFNDLYLTYLIHYPKNRNNIMGLLGDGDGYSENDKSINVSLYKLNPIDSYFFHDTIADFHNININNSTDIYIRELCEEFTDNKLSSCIADIKSTGDKNFNTNVWDIYIIKFWYKYETFINSTLYDPNYSMNIFTKKIDNTLGVVITIIFGCVIFILILTCIYLYHIYITTLTQLKLNNIRDQL